MAYYESDFAGETDATGAATIKLGPLSEKHVYFLGYVVLTVGGGQGCTITIETTNGFPLAGAAGLVPSAGPFLLKPGDYKLLQITDGPANAVVVGNLIGDVAEKQDDLLVRPQPTQAGTTVTGTNFAQITVTGPSDLQGAVTVEGALDTAGPIPWYDVKAKPYGAVGNSIADDTNAFGLTIAAAANGAAGIVFIPVGTYKVTNLAAIASHGISVWGCGTVCTMLNATHAGAVWTIAHPADSAVSPSGVYRGFSINGAAAPDAAYAFHVGDMVGLGFEEIDVKGFQAGANSIGFWFDNQVFFTERLTLYRVSVGTCTKCLRYTVNGGDQSFGYHSYVDLRLQLSTGQVGLSVEGGNVYNAEINAICNVGGAAGNTAAVIDMQGGTVIASGSIRAEQTSGTGAFIFRSNAGGPNPCFTWGGAPILYGTLAWSIGAGGQFALMHEFGAANGQSGAITLDARVANYWKVQVTGNLTSTTVANAAKGQEITIEYLQGALGPFAIVPPADMVFAGGAAPVWTATATHSDIVMARFDGSKWREVSRSLDLH